MIRKFVLALCATALVGVAAFGQTADELIEKNIKAHGGAAKIKAVKSVRMTGTMKVGPVDAALTVAKARPESVRVDFNVQGMIGTQAYDGSTGWGVMPFMGQPNPAKVSGDELDMIKEEADFDGPLIDYKSKGNKVEYIGKADVSGAPAHKLKLTLKNGREQFLYLDAASYLEIKLEGKRSMQGQEMETESLISGYKDFEGMPFATHIENHAKGMEGMGQTITIDKIELNPSLETAAFRMPEAKTEKPAEPKKD
jgi:outer membrane lipoprotein-sorting protein